MTALTPSKSKMPKRTAHTLAVTPSILVRLVYGELFLSSCSFVNGLAPSGSKGSMSQITVFFIL